jgi:protein-disulfide isomerase
VKLNRRETLSLAAAAATVGALGFALPASAKEGDMIDQVRLMAPAGVPDKVAGNPAAKVTVIEYASPTCPHCALFSNTVLGPLREKYVDTGLAKLIVRPFARNTLDAAIFMLAEAAAKAVDAGAAPAPAEPSAPSGEPAPAAPAEGEFSQAAVAAYENVLATYFRTQETWGISDKPLDAVKAVAFQLGFSEASFAEALTNQDLFAAIEKMRNQAMDEFGLEGTPTFYINGKQLTGEKSLEELSAEIDPLL